MKGRFAELCGDLCLLGSNSCLGHSEPCVSERLFLFFHSPAPVLGCQTAAVSAEEQRVVTKGSRPERRGR